MTNAGLEKTIVRERFHGDVIVRVNDKVWGVNTKVRELRRRRRLEFLAGVNRTVGSVLEVGCGPATFTKDLRRFFPELTAIDVSHSVLQAAKATACDVKFLNEDIHRTGFESETFNRIVGCGVLHHVNWDLALLEIYRILKPGGEIRFAEPNLLNPQVFLQKKWPWLKEKMGDSPDEQAFSERQIRVSLSKACFTDIEVVPFEFIHPATPGFMMPLLLPLENVLERTPLRHIAGSLKISARRPPRET